MSSVILFVPLHLFLPPPFCSLSEPEGKRPASSIARVNIWTAGEVNIGRRQEIPSSTLPNINNYEAIFYINRMKVMGVLVTIIEIKITACKRDVKDKAKSDERNIYVYFLIFAKI